VKEQKEEATRMETECEEFKSSLNERMNGVQRKGFGKLSSFVGCLSGNPKTLHNLKMIRI
jgi:hypothetical protein